MIVIPAIDIYDNKIVRLTKGDFDSVSYYKNTPLQQAKIFESFGFNIIHIVDLIGSKTGKLAAANTVKNIKAETNLKIEFGGGIRDMKTATEIVNTGVDYLILGSVSVKNKDELKLIIEKLSPGKIIIAIDAENEKLRISGWTEETTISLYSHIEYCLSLGIDKFLCTDILKDGMLTGANIELYNKVLTKYPSIKLIASGGVKDMSDIHKLNEVDIYAVVVGKAIYENKIELKELAQFAL